jgi:hypothetical protein
LNLSGTVLIQNNDEKMKIPASEFTLAESCDINIGDGDRKLDELYIYEGEGFQVNLNANVINFAITNHGCEVEYGDIEIISDNTVVSLVQEDY